MGKAYDDRPVADAGSYGLRPDGTAQENTRALQSAMTEAARIGGVVRIPPGDYIVESGRQ